MFAPLIAKPQAKILARSINNPPPRRAAAFEQRRRDWGVGQAQTRRHLPEGEPGIGCNAPSRSVTNLSDTPPNPPEQAAGLASCSPAPEPRLPASVQAKLEVGAVDDPLEHEADRVADQVMRMPARQVASAAAAPQISRKCAACEEEGKLQKKPAASSEGGVGEAPASVHEVLRSPGQPLDEAARAYFEPRFGRDFSRVRVHTDAQAAASARSVNALAYTAGEHIVFGPGADPPMSDAGRRLMAHELAHLVQQGSGLRRMSLGRGKAPEELRVIPDEERGRVLAAISQLRTVAYDTSYAACQQAFAETCPGGTPSSLRKAFDAAVLWRFPPGERLGAGASTICNTTTMAYTDTGYSGGEASLAYDLLHELGHICGIACPDLPHYFADKLALNCLGPMERNENSQLTLTAGRSTEDWLLILSYGWLLQEWRAGRLSLRLDADFDVLGLLHALQGKGSAIGGTTLDLRARPFSGEHFGGLSFHGGLGGQFGRFRVRPPAAGDPPAIRSAAALVLEVGSRIEWWVKDESALDEEGTPGRVKPRALDFSYRLIQPATSNAERIHEFLVSYSLYF